LLIISGILDFFLRNTFPFVVFTSYGERISVPLPDRENSLRPGGFFLAFAATLQPFYNAAGAYSTSGTNTIEGQESPVYAASFGKKPPSHYIP